MATGVNGAVHILYLSQLTSKAGIQAAGGSSERPLRKRSTPVQLSSLEELAMKNSPQHQNWISRMLLPAASAALAVAVVLASAVTTTQSAQAQTLTVLYSFTGGTDGSSPTTGLIRDSAGNLYGTTGGGAFGAGVVFKVDKHGTETVLYSFMNSSDGGFPQSGPIRDTAGNLYGTTKTGGVFGYGTVYELSPTGVETVLYSFAGPGGDGSYPLGGVVRDTAGNFYGTTSAGGSFALGTVYKLSSTGTETILHNFGNGTDGTNPYTGVIRSGSTLYGTTLTGGSLGVGTVWKLSSSGTETVLHNFAGGQTDGAYPEGTLLLANGNFYGTTYEGGTHGGPGIVYELSLHGAETVLHNFAEGADDGGVPYAGVIRDAAGNLYGTTGFGGASNDGTVYELTGGNVSVLYSFCSALNCSDGKRPYSGLLRDGAGNLYGTTELGGAYGFGTVWKLTP
jgi:uncharacterized repeat protein (TIGR03803 family)